MLLSIEIPDEIANRLLEEGVDLSRRALEAFALGELRRGRITEAELYSIFGLGRIAADGFLKAHGIYEDYSMEDFEKERAALKELGL